jgi:translation initiation factor 3 subunit E
MEEENKYGSDLTSVMAPFLDIHMMSPLLDFLRETELYDTTDIAKEKIRIFVRTNMIDLVEEEMSILPEGSAILSQPELDKEKLSARTDAIFDKIDNAPEDVKKCEDFFSNEEVIADLKANANLNIDYVSANHDISLKMLEEYYKYGKFKYDCGLYAEAYLMLGNFLSVHQSQSVSVLGALWGRLACRILQGLLQDQWDESIQDLNAVKDVIESRSIPAVDQLNHRAWLMHWGLFIFLNLKNGCDLLLDFFSEKVYLQTLENLCPWLLRYYSCAAMMSTKRRDILRGVVDEIQSMSHLYSDSFTQLVESLYDRFDLDEAQEHLKKCLETMKQDFFLHSYVDKFLYEVRVSMCELHCGLNRRVDMTMLSEKMQLSEDEAEKWMVDMVRGTVAMDGAKIDSSGKQVIMPVPSKSGHQKVMDRTRELTVRSSILTSNVTSLLSEQATYIQAMQSQGN